MKPTIVGPLAGLLSLAICHLIRPTGGDNYIITTNATRLPQPAGRIKDEPESVWVEFVQLALDNEPLNLGQGFPDFAAPKYLVDSLHNATSQLSQASVLAHQYTRPFGHPRLVRALRDYYSKFRNFTKLTNANEQILVTVGAYEALFVALMAFVGPGDEVLLLDPAFDAYAPMVAMAGGRSVYVPLRPRPRASSSSSSSNSTPGDTPTSSSHFELDMAEFEAKLSERTRVLVLNTPNNPLGKMFTRRELQQVAALCVSHNLLVVADEVYDQFHYDASEHLSIAQLGAEMWARTVTIGSAGKTFSVTGWKVGWALGPRELIRYLQLVHQTAVYTVATPLQEALARALEHEMDQLAAGRDSYWAQLRRELALKRDRMATILQRAHMRPIIPQGGYFMLADFEQLARRHPEYKQQQHQQQHPSAGNATATSATNDFQFARWLSRAKKLQGIPAGAFYSRENQHLAANLIRFCFIKQADTFDKLDRLVATSLA